MWIITVCWYHSEKAMAPHSSTLAWKILWMEEPGKLQSMGSLRVGHEWATSLSRIGEGNGNLLQCSCLENPGDRGAWWAAIYGVAQNWTRLKRLSSSFGIITLYFKWDIKNLLPFRSFALTIKKKKIYIYIYIYLFQVFPLHTLTQQMLLFLFPPTDMN